MPTRVHDQTNTSDASYSIVHDGGLWQFLGSYAFDLLLSPTVMLAANDNGSVAADAIRFVGGPAGATDVAYLHSDHLSTPEVMIDASAQIL